jgi:site-specific DNA-methyltransferase (adenine-specific)
MDLDIIYNEDCFDTLARMDKDSVDYVFTSPPYNRLRGDKYSEYDDTENNYFEFLVGVTEGLLRVARKNVFINIQKTFYNKVDVFRYLGQYADSIFDVFIWGKNNPMPAAGGSITNAYEFVVCFGSELKSNKSYTKNLYVTNVNKGIYDKHKAIMNIEAADFFTYHFMLEGDVVYDPFMGTGTTAVSAKKFGVNYIGSEISEEYCRVARERLNNRLDFKDFG